MIGEWRSGSHYTAEAAGRPRGAGWIVSCLPAHLFVMDPW
jgi:hypothetical protein